MSKEENNLKENEIIWKSIKQMWNENSGEAWLMAYQEKMKRKYENNRRHLSMKCVC